MKHTHIVHPFRAQADRSQGTKPAEVPPPPAAPHYSTLIPFELDGFKLDLARIYDQDNGDKSQKVCDVVLRMKGTDKSAPWYILANITRVIYKDAAKKAGYELRMPSQKKAGGAFYAALLKSDSNLCKAALEQFKADLVANDFFKWASQPEVKAAVKAGGGAAGVRQGGVELDLEF